MRRSNKFLIFISLLICFQTVNAGWVKQNAGTLAWLRTVFFADERTGWIGGSGGTFLATNDGGDSWKQAEKFTGDSIRQIHFTDKDNGWLLCERDVYSLGANAPSYLLKTSNGGASWEKIEFSAGGGGRTRVAKIFFSKNKLGFAVGESGAIFILGDDDKTWKKQPSPVRYLLLDGAFADKLSGVLVGAGGNIFFTDDAGISWNQASLAQASGVRLNSVFFVNKDTGWTAGGGGRIFQSVSGGKNWREQKSGVSTNINDIFFRDTRQGWAVGDEGTILRSTTGGNIWTKEDLKSRHKLENLASNGRDVFAVGFGGTILRYNFSGENKTSNTGAPVLKKNVR